jgi:hypothetical protein
MRGGVELSADIYRPDGKGSYICMMRSETIVRSYKLCWVDSCLLHQLLFLLGRHRFWQSTHGDASAFNNEPAYTVLNCLPDSDRSCSNTCVPISF